ncbi:MAG TPA: LysM domain-containing protein [Thermoleophilaceae bacterium]|nr:LysM domain-containing protein [Thermoleophilaceae bacterium]
MALIAVIVALMAIISGNGNSSGSGSGSSSATTASTTTPAAKTTTKKKSSSKSKTKSTTTSGTGPKTYTVQVGDTLGGIAAKTGVPLSKIQELNPDVDPHTMNAGQQIRLR